MKKVKDNYGCQVVDNIVNDLFKKPTYEFFQDGDWKAYLSKYKTSMVMVRQEEEDDRLVIINRSRPDDKVKNEKGYFVIGNTIFDYHTKDELHPQVLVDDLMDYYNNEYKY